MCVELTVHHPECQGRDVKCTCDPLRRGVCGMNPKVFPRGCLSFTPLTLFEGRTFVRKGPYEWIGLDGPHNFGEAEEVYILDRGMAQQYEFVREYVSVKVWLESRKEPICWADLLEFLYTRLGGEGGPELPKVTQVAEAMVEVLEYRLGL
ncbi:uncharacterized protein DNG_08142 [Cephalotrichum gorgonifer]|uniref:Uncharacterized protein n=1 Tax=Cephalotrichum gorgonifer TaxID=2041049 RepID=A0AAE8N602_9PEZI|nr:uncharacterized protein DNG_08142 [Cephalotrichum gorgonifer]